MDEYTIKRMVNRFLGWKLPTSFAPDAGISFNPDFNVSTAHPMRHEPTGANLFDAQQTEKMIRYMIEPDSFQKETFKQVAYDLRNAKDETHFRAVLSNNHNVIIAALEAQSL